ncbi:MAG: winged helix-turn-helix domain-containing tetratricopeptide repeat protein [Rhizobiaceae bacterium]
MNFRFGPFSLDSQIPELRQNGEVVPVEPKVFDILLYLINHRDRIISKDELISEVWSGRIVSDAAITSRINLVRQAVGDSGRSQNFIQTVSKRGYRFVAEVTDSSEPVEERTSSTEPVSTGSAFAASVLVLPFSDLSQVDSGFLAQGLTEDLIVALSRHSDVAVISMQTAQRLGERQSWLENPLAEINADYLISGTVRFSGNKVRVTVQLAEKSSGITIYSEKFDRQIDDVFALQDEIVQQLAGCLPWRVIDDAGRKIARNKPPNLSSYQALLKISHGNKQQFDIINYLQELHKILETDSNYAFVHSEISFFLAYKVFFTGQQEEAEVNKAIDHARKAVQLAPDNERVLAKSAMAFQFAEQFSVAHRLSAQAMELNPNSTDCTHFHATIIGASGEAEAALELHKKTQQLDPLFPEAHYEGMVEVLYLLGRYEEALEIIDRWQAPSRHILAYTGALAAMTGDKHRAKKAIEEFHVGNPARFSNMKFVASLLRYHKLKKDREHWLTGFENAGLSEMDTVRKLGMI